MASKLSAARIASWSGIRAVIARATIDDVLVSVTRAAEAGTSGIGTTFHGSDRALSARQLWVAFASEVRGSLTVDEGAARAMLRGTVSLLPAGVVAVEGAFEAGETVDVRGSDGAVLARGLASMSAGQARVAMGRRTSQLDEGSPSVVVHRDELVLLPR